MPDLYQPLSLAIREKEATSNVAMLNVNLVSLEDFEVYLHESLNELFYSCNTVYCPIARYLKQRFDDMDISVGLYRAYKMVCGVEETLIRFEIQSNTLWMFQFIERFDAYHKSHIPRTGQEVLDFLQGWKDKYGYNKENNSNSLKTQATQLPEEGGDEKQEATGEVVAPNLQG